MAEKTPQEEIMALVPLKQALGLAETKPLACALALTKDRKDAVLLVDRTAKPKKAGDKLRNEGKALIENSTLRFGRVSFDLENDPGTARFTLSKSEPGGMVMHTVKLIKRAGYQAAIFHVDETLEHETSEGDEAESSETTTPPSQVSAPPSPPNPQQPSAQQMSATMAKLTPGIKAAMASHPELREALHAAAESFVALLRANDLSGAMHSLEDVARLLKEAGPGQQKPSASGGDYAKARAAWNEAIETVDGQIEKLTQTLRATGHPLLLDIAEYGMNAVTNNHKVPLMAALMELGTGAPEALAKVGPKALALVRAFRQHIETDARVAVCDDNPLNVPLSIRGTLVPALAGLEQSLSAATAS